MKSFFEQNGGTYSVINDYYIPNLTVPEQPENHIGVWGRRRLDYLKHHRRVIYTNLLTSGKLYEHLIGIEQAVQDQFDALAGEMAVNQGVTEKLKAENQMQWVGKMNNIRNCAEEIVLAMLIYV